MTLNPIIPIIIMAIISIFLLVIVIINKKHLVTRILIIILLFVINLRPMELTSEVETFNTNLDILFVVDTTISMDAEDIKDTRLLKAGSDIKYIMKELPGSNYALITFNRLANIISPFTFDAKMIETAVDNLQTEDILYATGTVINNVVEPMELLITSSSKRETSNTIVFFITDGEFNKNDDMSGFNELSKYISSGAVLGYGTKEGGRIKLNPDSNSYYTTRVDEEGYLLDKDTYPYKQAISKLDENNLNKLANNLGISYINMSNTSNINSKIKEIKSGINYNTTSKTVGGKDYYYFISIFLIPLFLYELIIYRREL